MQHQQQMRMPEREDVARHPLDVLGAHVLHTQGGVESADEESGEEGNELHGWRAQFITAARVKIRL